MFCFGGRRKNLELQLPFIKRIMDENPHVEYHLWNLARDPEDDKWIRTLAYGYPMPRVRFKVRNDFAGPKPWEHFGDVYAEYAHPHFEKCHFIKMDDDVVFLESERFADFEQAVKGTRVGIVSAKVINNGACTPHWSRLSDDFARTRIKLLDVHKHKQYAELSHGYFFDRWQLLINQDKRLIPTKDWLSINLIGYDWNMGVKLTGLLGTPSPRMIAGRPYRPAIHRVGDEGAVNMLPRYIMQGFTACHLYFGPQAKQMPTGQIDGLREQYRIIGEKYLAQ